MRGGGRGGRVEDGAGELGGIGDGCKQGIQFQWELSIRLGVEGKEKKEKEKRNGHAYTHTHTHIHTRL